MTDMMSGVENAENSNPGTGLDEQLVAQLVSRAKAGGPALTGEGGVLAQLTKRLPESALEGEITDHLGCDKHDPAGREGPHVTDRMVEDLLTALRQRWEQDGGWSWDERLSQAETAA